MDFYSSTIQQTAKALGTNISSGLNKNSLEKNLKIYGYNQLTKKKKEGFFKKLFGALKEPMLLILIFSFCIALGSSIGEYVKTKTADFTECFGILCAIVLSTAITLIMEGSSAKAFETLNKIYDNATVKVLREGQVIVINQKYLAVGDVVLLSGGDKIFADGRLIESNFLSVDESALTGESNNSDKFAEKVLNLGAPLAERENCVYSGTFVISGSGKMIVTAVGDATEIGVIAKELKKEEKGSSPLQIKLAKLGKIIAGIGFASAIFIFAVSILKLVLTNSVTFNGVKDIFISCIVLIVAAVPEGLPTIVAISLALNMIKLASENALIKKMVATETAGAVSVICSDKTGTLTQNKMSVEKVYIGELAKPCSFSKPDYLTQNFIINNTAEVILKGKTQSYSGSGTECAILKCALLGEDFTAKEYRSKHSVVYVQPFNSDQKMMITVIKLEKGYRVLIKGAPEIVLSKCNLPINSKSRILDKIASEQSRARRALCFAHVDVEEFEYFKDNLVYNYDGFVSLFDPLRPEVKKAIDNCVSAGIKVKILTGDNLITAKAIASELKIIDSQSQVINATDLEKLSDEEFIKAIQKVSVIARSTPIIKLRVVKALKKLGEIVAVTGDGINDAPAIKQADVGIAMGVSGSEITKEAADVILLDDSFATVVKTIFFGRNVFKNLQRFILFQLSVNVSALILIIVCTVLGLPAPFNTLQLLWINVIMDGPPALTLGLEKCSDAIMKEKPISKSEHIVSKNMLIRIIFNGIFIGGILLAQYFYNFMAVTAKELKSVIFTVFILFQLFNAFNCRELGSNSILKGMGKNKIMGVTFFAVFIVHFIIVQFAYGVFGISPLSLISWIKCIGLAFSIIVVNEAIKFAYRTLKNRNSLKVIINKG